MTNFSYFLIFIGVTNIMTNLGAFCHADKIVRPKVWAGNNEFRPELHGLRIICLLKALGCVVPLIEAKLTLNVFKPILKEFSDAE